MSYMLAAHENTVACGSWIIISKEVGWFPEIKSND